MKNLLQEMWLEVAIEGEVVATEGAAGTEAQVVENGGQAAVEGTETPPVQAEEPTFEIDGEKLTPAQIKDYKNGYMRQSDYTRKTQEIARLREEHKDALELYDYLKNNPDIARQLAELTPEGADLKTAKDLADPTSKKFQELEMRFKTQEIESQLREITSKDDMVTDVELLEIANENRIGIDKAYVLWKGLNADKIFAKKSAELTKQIQQNSNITKTLITNGDKPSVTDFGLSKQEIDMAEKLGMTAEEYAKWKN